MEARHWRVQEREAPRRPWGTDHHHCHVLRHSRGGLSRGDLSSVYHWFLEKLVVGLSVTPRFTSTYASLLRRRGPRTLPAWFSSAGARWMVGLGGGGGWCAAVEVWLEEISVNHRFLEKLVVGLGVNTRVPLHRRSSPPPAQPPSIPGVVLLSGAPPINSWYGSLPPASAAAGNQTVLSLSMLVTAGPRLVRQGNDGFPQLAPMSQFSVNRVVVARDCFLSMDRRKEKSGPSRAYPAGHCWSMGQGPPPHDGGEYRQFLHGRSARWMVGIGEVWGPVPCFFYLNGGENVVVDKYVFYQDREIL